MIEKEELKTIIPHKGKMMLLSRIIDYNTDEKYIRAEFDITEDCIFFDPVAGGVPVWAGFEFIAQAISAFTGLRGREKGEKPNPGFILSIPSMYINHPVYKPGSTVEIRIKERDYTDVIYTFDGETFLEGKKTMEGKIMVMEIDVNDDRFKDFLSNFV